MLDNKNVEKKLKTFPFSVVSANTFLGPLTNINFEKTEGEILVKVVKLFLHPLKNSIDKQVRFHYGFPQDCGSGPYRYCDKLKYFGFQLAWQLLN